MIPFLVFLAISALSLLTMLTLLLVNKLKKESSDAVSGAALMCFFFFLVPGIISLIIYCDVASSQRDYEKMIIEYQSVRESVSNMEPGRIENTSVYLEVVEQNKWLRTTQAENHRTSYADWEIPDAVDTMTVIKLK